MRAMKYQDMSVPLFFHKKCGVPLGGANEKAQAAQECPYNVIIAV